MKRIMIFLGVTLILLASCADFLDPESKSEYIPEDVSSLNSLLIQYDFGTGSISSLLELLDDDVAVQPTGISEIAGFTGKGLPKMGERCQRMFGRMFMPMY